MKENWYRPNNFLWWFLTNRFSDLNTGASPSWFLKREVVVESLKNINKNAGLRRLRQHERKCGVVKILEASQCRQIWGRVGKWTNFLPNFLYKVVKASLLWNKRTDGVFTDFFILKEVGLIIIWQQRSDRSHITWRRGLKPVSLGSVASSQQNYILKMPRHTLSTVKIVLDKLFEFFLRE